MLALGRRLDGNNNRTINHGARTHTLSPPCWGKEGTKEASSRIREIQERRIRGIQIAESEKYMKESEKYTQNTAEEKEPYMVIDIHAKSGG